MLCIGLIARRFQFRKALGIRRLEDNGFVACIPVQPCAAERRGCDPDVAVPCCAQLPDMNYYR